MTRWLNSNLFAAVLSSAIALALPVVGSYWLLCVRVGQLEVHTENTREDVRDIKADVKEIRDELRHGWLSPTLSMKPEKRP